MRFGRRDHERYIGGYDPEHEMPDPYRDPRDRWQSDAYRRNAADGRWAYRWNPDRFEERMPRDRYEYWDREREMMERERWLDRYRPYYDYPRDPWAVRDRYDRERFRDDWEWLGGEWEREGRYGRGGGRY
jgi:hypothetical protein